jgi:hypothetical protein
MNNKVFIAAALFALCAAAFAQNASDFKTDGKGTITGFDGWDKEITIPAQIDGVNIRAIGDSAFKNMGITKLTIPAGIRIIGREAFQGNKLTSLTLPDHVIVNPNAFSDNALKSITAGNDVWILPQAFSNNSLTSITAGNDVIIWKDAFPGTKTDRGIIINSCDVTLGDGCSISSGAFAGFNLQKLVLGANIDISRGAFGMSAYYDYIFNSRKAGTYDNNAKYASKTEGDYKFIPAKYGAVITQYTGNEGSRLDIPAQLGGTAVKGIDGYYVYENLKGAFQEKNISRMRLPDSIVYIGDNAFRENQLTSVTIPDSVTIIGDGAFRGNKLTNVTIPNNVISIGNSAFRENKLTSVTIGNSVTTIGEGTFMNNELSSVTIGNSVKTIGAAAFQRNKITSVTIPNSVETIGEGAFNGNNLLSVTIGAKVRVSDNNFFNKTYNSSDRQAGTYTCTDTKSNTWARQ